MSGELPSNTARFALRVMNAQDDTSAFQRWARDARIMNPLNLPARQLTPQQVTSYWTNSPNRTFLGIFDAAGHPVGFWDVEFDLLHASALITIGIDPEYRGTSVVLETAIALFDWLFDVKQVEKISSFTLSTNRQIRTLMKWGGFKEEALLKRELKSLTGGAARLDQVRLGLLPEDWKPARENLRAVIARKNTLRAARQSDQDNQSAQDNKKESTPHV